MQSPFSDYSVEEKETHVLFPGYNEITNVLVDPEQLESAFSSGEAFPEMPLEVPYLDVERAVRFNRTYQNTLWGTKLEAIRKYFASKGFLPGANDSTEKSFAFAIAKWQASVFSERKKIDGVLGPVSWSILSGQINAVQTVTPSQTRSKWNNLITGATPCEAEPLVYGPKTFEQMVKAIRSANSQGHFIYILGWMLDVDFELIPGDPSTTLYNLLAVASGKGVEIRILIWDNVFYQTEINLAASYVNKLANAAMVKDNTVYGSQSLKAAIARVASVINSATQMFPLLNAVSQWSDLKTKINVIKNEGSHHEKVLVIKGAEGLIGFCGGIDINPDRREGRRVRYLQLPISPVNEVKRLDPGCYGSDILHDVHCRVKGMAAWLLLQRFIKRWFVNTAMRGVVPVPLKGMAEMVPPVQTMSPGMSYVRILHTYNHPIDPTKKERTIREVVRIAINNAEKSIHIEDQYMISLEIASWINDRIKHHINNPDFKVTLLSQDDSFAGADIMFPQSMRKKFIDQLFEGIAPGDMSKARSKVSFLMMDPCNPPCAHHKVHSKLYIIDKELAIIGSANCSSRSMTHDAETAAVFFNDPGTANGFVERLSAAIVEKNVVPYVPSRTYRDKDVEIINELNNLSTGKQVLLGIATGSLGNTIPHLVTFLTTSLKPALIDIIDPDADQTLLQQEVYETLNQDNSLYEQSSGIQVPGQNGFAYQTLPSPSLYEMTEEQNEAKPCNCGDHAFDKYRVDNESPFSSEAFALNEVIDQQIAPAPPVIKGRTSWAKQVLNNICGLSLPADNKLDDAAKKAIGDFQAQNGLPRTLLIDGVTERAMLEADALRRYSLAGLQNDAATIINEARTKIEDWTKKAVNNKPKFILNSYRDPRTLYAFVLHQMAFKRKNSKSKLLSDPESYLSTGAHFCIMLDGRIIQLHPLSRMIWHGNCLSPRSVAVEFEGNFPNTRGQWWVDHKSTVQNKDVPTQAQYDSGRFLARYLKLVLDIKHILAHRQGSDTRDNDPGPDIWYNVGEWAVNNLSVSDGGPGFKCGTGKPLLADWKNWGEKQRQPVANEYYQFEASEQDMNEEWENQEREWREEEDYGEPEAMDEIENWHPTGNEHTYEFDSNNEVVNINDAITKNRYLATRLGWNQYYNQINDLLLPYSGQQAVSLGEEAFAHAVAAWQTANGFSAKDADGIIGPKTWTIMQQNLSVKSTASSSAPSTTGVMSSAPDAIQIIDGVRFKRKNSGWAAYGGGDLRTRLKALKQKIKLNITDNEIEMFSLISVPESGGLVNAINSWDSAYMSMGFIQFTIRYYELQEVIRKASSAFARHGIELDDSRLYYPNEKRSVAIKNAPNIADLRSLDWAVRFYRAGLEDDVIIAQIEVARGILNEVRRRFDPGNYLARFNNSYPNLWAFIYESNNSRPAVLHRALRAAISKAAPTNVSDPVQFGKILISELNTATYNYYNGMAYKNEVEKKQRVKDELDKVGRVIAKTGVIK